MEQSFKLTRESVWNIMQSGHIIVHKQTNTFSYRVNKFFVFRKIIYIIIIIIKQQNGGLASRVTAPKCLLWLWAQFTVCVEFMCLCVIFFLLSFLLPHKNTIVSALLTLFANADCVVLCDGLLLCEQCSRDRHWIPSQHWPGQSDSWRE